MSETYTYMATIQKHYLSHSWRLFQMTQGEYKIDFCTHETYKQNSCMKNLQVR